ncbi:MAG: Oxidoreductase [Candidatus Adlerbacteria bacterium]|nr:Oxidoreductase [Candidatus Adlerbacteria bacterium]
MSLRSDLVKIVKGEIDDSQESLEAYSRDASLFYVKPAVIVRPLDAKDIGRIVRYAMKAKHKDPKSTVSLTARSAGTDMSGGPLNDSIIVDMTRHFNKLEGIQNMSVTVEPGMYFRDFDQQTQQKNLELPSYTASRELNTVGGMVANNSGGEKNLQYGKTARYVEELDVVLADGKVHTLKRLVGDNLRAKLAEQSFEGDLYRNVSQLLSAHTKIIEDHKPHVEKNSSGYALWDIGDGKESLDLARLMVGAQGTLGIITKIKFRLVNPKPYSAMVVAFVGNLSELGALVPIVLKHKPDSFESYDDHTFALGAKYFPEFAVQMKAGIFSLGWSFLPEVWMMLTGGIPKLVLMAEFRALSQSEAITKAEDLAEELHEIAGAKVRIAPSEKAARKYWVIRRESFSLLRKKIRGKRTAPFIDDFVVPPLTLPEFLPKLEEILSHYDLTYTIAGHVGDGNFHIIPLVDASRPDLGKIIDELSHKVYDLVISYQGSITGEHNDGLVRTPYVEKMFGPDMYALFHEVKQIFDPLNIFNPGKKVGTTFSQALSHLDTPITPKI